VNKELLMSSAAMEDNYDLSSRSRQRDQDVMNSVNKAIRSNYAATELYSSPRASVATRRAMRGQSTPPGYYQSSANISKSEAALIGNKVDVTTPRRRPKSAYGQAKARQLYLQGSSRDASPVGATSALAADTSGLRAHKPVSVQTKAKPIQDVDGPRRPNIMSWQYRIDAYTPPDDLVFYPRKLSTVKNQVLELKAKLDHHKQLMDRYLVTDTGLSADDMRVVAASKAYLGSRA